MKEVLESNKLKPQHIFIGAMIVNLVFFLFWKFIKIIIDDFVFDDHIFILLSNIVLISHYISLYFLVWIERRIGNGITLKLPIFGLIILECIFTIIHYIYPLSLDSFSQITLHIPGAILMVILIYFLLKKQGVYSVEFKFIGTSLLISKGVIMASPIVFGVILDSYFTGIISYSSLNEAIGFVVVVPKIAILVLMIKCLKESTETQTEVLENY